MKFDMMPLADGIEFSTDCDKTGLNNNVIVCGTSGSGKTVSVSEPMLLNTYNSNVVITVTKRRLVDKYKPVFENRGYDVQEMNFVSPELGNVGFDPLTYVNSPKEITFLATSVVKANPQKNNSNQDPYWDDCAISLLAAEIAYCMENNPNASFADVLDMHNHLGFKKEYRRITTNFDEDFVILEEENPDSFAVTCWKSFITLPENTAGCVMSILNTALDTIFTDDLKRNMRLKKQVNFDELANNKTILFVVTSPVNPALTYYVNMFYGHVFKELFEIAERQPNGKLPIPVRVLCDDFATGGKIVNFAEYISIFREKGLSVVLLLQSESQLSALYGEYDSITIINNCDTYLFMGGTDLGTCRRICTMINKPLEEVLWMKRGNVILMRRSNKPVIAPRYKTLNDTRYMAITKAYEESIASDESNNMR